VIICDRKALTRVVTSYYGSNWRPDKDESNSRPGTIHGGGTPSDCEEDVAARLDDVVDCHHEDRDGKTQSKVLVKLSSPRSFCPYNRRIVGEDNGEVPGDRCQRSKVSRVAGDQDLDLDIAVHSSLPSRKKDEVVRPDERVDEAAEVEDRKPDDEETGRYVLVPPMPGQGHDAQEKRDATRPSEKEQLGAHN
jgi:hypothetical protein